LYSHFKTGIYAPDFEIYKTGLTIKAKAAILVMSDGTTIDVARNKKKALLKKLL